MKGGAEPPFMFDRPAAAALSAEPKARGPAAKPPGGGAEPPFMFDRPPRPKKHGGNKGNGSETDRKPLLRNLV